MFCGQTRAVRIVLGQDADRCVAVLDDQVGQCMGLQSVRRRGPEVQTVVVVGRELVRRVRRRELMIPAPVIASMTVLAHAGGRRADDHVRRRAWSAVDRLRGGVGRRVTGVTLERARPAAPSTPPASLMSLMASLHTGDLGRAEEGQVAGQRQQRADSARPCRRRPKAAAAGPSSVAAFASSPATRYSVSVVVEGVVGAELQDAEAGDCAGSPASVKAQRTGDAVVVDVAAARDDLEAGGEVLALVATEGDAVDVRRLKTLASLVPAPAAASAEMTTAS